MCGIALTDGSDPTLAAELRSWLERTTSIFADRTGGDMVRR